MNMENKKITKKEVDKAWDKACETREVLEKACDALEKVWKVLEKAREKARDNARRRLDER